MATTANHFTLLFGLLVITCFDFTGGQVGVCFGRLGNNLPGVQRTIALYKKYNIRRMRLYDPHPPTLRALNGSNIRLMMGVPHADLQDLANCPQVATAWVQRYILRYPNVTFRYISVGNEVDPASEFAPFVLPAMQNIYRAVRAAGRAGQIRVSTSIKADLLNTSFPPKAGEFKCSVNWYIRPILEFLRDTRSPILVNVYPYFAYLDDMKNINLSFALLQPNSGVVADGVYYDNLFYAILDAVYAAVDKILAAASPLSVGGYSASLQTDNGGNVVVSETGTPSKGGGQTASIGDGSPNTVENARIYTNNLMRIVRSGTPRRPGRPIETFIFAMFDENLKPGPPYERHFGLFTPNGQPKYPFRFR